MGQRRENSILLLSTGSPLAGRCAEALVNSVTRKMGLAWTATVRALAAEAGLEIGRRGGIRVDARMRTSDPSIRAVGDAVEKVAEKRTSYVEKVQASDNLRYALGDDAAPQGEALGRAAATDPTVKAN